MKAISVFFVSVLIVVAAEAEADPEAEPVRDTKVSRATLIAVKSHLKTLLGSLAANTKIRAAIREATTGIVQHRDEFASNIRATIEHIEQAWDSFDWQHKSISDKNVRENVQNSMKALKGDANHIKTLLRDISATAKREYPRLKARIEVTMKDGAIRAMDIAKILAQKTKNAADGYGARALECLNENADILQNITDSFYHSFEECGYTLQQKSSAVLDKLQTNAQNAPEIVETIAGTFESCLQDSEESTEQINCVLDATTTGNSQLHDKINEIYNLYVSLKLNFLEMAFKSQDCILNTVSNVYALSQDYTKEFDGCLSDKKLASKES